MIDILIYKGREELEVSAEDPMPPLCHACCQDRGERGLPCLTSPSWSADSQSVALQHKQRHHLIGQFVVAPSQKLAEMHRKKDISTFLERFYNNQLAA